MRPANVVARDEVLGSLRLHDLDCAEGLLVGLGNKLRIHLEVLTRWAELDPLRAEIGLLEVAA
jgi:hypothetical protein